MSSSDRDRHIDAILARYRKLLQERWPTGPVPIDQIEQIVEEISREIDRETEQRILDDQRPPRPNHEACPHCGRRARYRRMATRVLITIHGERSLSRPYYYCSPCERGFAPLDDQLGLDREATTPQLRLWLVHEASRGPSFVAGAATLQRYTGLQISPATIERVAVATGTALAAAHREQAQQHRAGRLPEATVRPQRLYVGIDGKLVPLREAWKRDGSTGELVCRYGECKTGVVYEALPGRDGDAGVRCKA
jgi:hypothetical protein